MYHPESDSLFEIDASDLPGLLSTIDGQLCNDVTGSTEWERRFRKRRQ